MPSNNTVSESLLDEKDVATFLHVSLGTVRRWRLFRKGPKYIKVSDASVRYRPADVDAYLASRPCGGGLSER
jgi:predicted DNA-binding transcriptional regulator AlpA